MSAPATQSVENAAEAHEDGYDRAYRGQPRPALPPVSRELWTAWAEGWTEGRGDHIQARRIMPSDAIDRGWMAAMVGYPKDPPTAWSATMACHWQRGHLNGRTDLVNGHPRRKYADYRAGYAAAEAGRPRIMPKRYQGAVRGLDYWFYGYDNFSRDLDLAQPRSAQAIQSEHPDMYFLGHERGVQGQPLALPRRLTDLLETDQAEALALGWALGRREAGHDR